MKGKSCQKFTSIYLSYKHFYYIEFHYLGTINNTKYTEEGILYIYSSLSSAIFLGTNMRNNLTNSEQLNSYRRLLSAKYFHLSFPTRIRMFFNHYC